MDRKPSTEQPLSTPPPSTSASSAPAAPSTGTAAAGSGADSPMMLAAEELLAQLLTWNPRKRPSCTAALRDSAFFKAGRGASGVAQPPARGGGGLGAGAGGGMAMPSHAPPPSRRTNVRDGEGRWGASKQRGFGAAFQAVIDEARLRQLFERFDADESGAIDKWELALLLIELGLLTGTAGPEQEAATRAWLAKMDADGNGTIEWEELRDWWYAPGGGKALVSAARLVTKLRDRMAARKSKEGASGAAAAKGGASTSAKSSTAKVSADGGVGGLNKKDTHAMRSLFAKHDADFSGYIDQQELLPLLIDLGVISRGHQQGDDEADDLLVEMEMAEIDENGDDQISFEELCTWWANSGRGPPPERDDVAAAKALSRRLLD